MSDATGAGNPPPRPPALGWRDLSAARVGLWGVRLEGLASLRRLRQMHVTPVLVDDRPAFDEVDGLPVLTGGSGGHDALAACDVVVKSPGISRYGPVAEALVAAGVALVGGLGLWLEEADRSRVCSITGTKGKSTTAAVAGHLLEHLGYRSLVAGNIGRPPWDPEAGDDWDYWILETSSYQATDLTSSPPVVAVTSLAPDHLDWHGSVERYYRDKLSACTQPGAELTVADGTSEELRRRAALLGPSVRWVLEGDPSLDGAWVDALELPARHYHRDALIARACLTGLGVPEACDEDLLRRAARGFAPLESRFHPIGTVDGVEFVDDSLATNVLPTLAALEAMGSRPVALLVGGQDRGLDYAPLGRAVAVRGAPTLVVALPTAGERARAAVEEALAQRLADISQVDLLDAAELGTATQAAFEWARQRPGAAVLLSPAAPSFGQFRNYKERSAAFAQAVAACSGRARIS